MEKNETVKKLPYVGAKIDKMLDGNSAVKAFATITIANSFMVHNINVIEGNKGLFVAMPNQSYQNNNGDTKYSDICHAISAEMKHRIDEVVLKAYDMAQSITQTDGSGEGNDDDNPLEEPDDQDEDSDMDDTESVGFIPSM